MERVIIAAVAENGVIGADGGIPWHYPKDFEHFKETTIGHPVIMGKTTFDGIVEGLDGPLPDRLNIVLSFEPYDVPDGVVNVHSIEDALAAAQDSGDGTVFIAGGASIYAQFLDEGLVDRMILTRIPETLEGDTYFPDWDEANWVCDDEYVIGDGLPVEEWVTIK